MVVVRQSREATSNLEGVNYFFVCWEAKLGSHKLTWTAGTTSLSVGRQGWEAKVRSHKLFGERDLLHCFFKILVKNPTRVLLKL